MGARVLSAEGAVSREAAAEVAGEAEADVVVGDWATEEGAASDWAAAGGVDGGAVFMRDKVESAAEKVCRGRSMPSRCCCQAGRMVSSWTFSKALVNRNSIM